MYFKDDVVDDDDFKKNKKIKRSKNPGRALN
jgi:hypothetical protein